MAQLAHVSWYGHWAKEPKYIDHEILSIFYAMQESM